MIEHDYGELITKSGQSMSIMNSLDFQVLKNYLSLINNTFRCKRAYG